MAALLRRRLHSALVTRLAVPCSQTASGSTAGSAPVGWPIAQIIVAVAVVASSASSGARTPASVLARRGLPLRVGSDSPGFAGTAPGLGSARGDPIAAPGDLAGEARTGSAAAAGVLVAALRLARSSRKTRTGALPLDQRWKRLRRPYWGTSCSRERKNPPRCLGCPSRACLR